MSDVLLINPANTLDRYGAAKEMAPLGMLSIAAVLEQHGYDVRVVDLEFGTADIGAVVEEAHPVLVGIGGTSTTRFNAFDVARTVKRISRRIVTVYGGSHATFTAQDTLEHVPEIDIVVRGEGETATLDVVECLASGESLHKVKGISWRCDGGIIHNASAPRIQNLDALPFPARHLVDMGAYDLRLDLLGKKAASIITSRGCPVNCSFCSASAMFGRTVTYRSAENVVNEIAHLMKGYDVGGFKIFDSTFTISRRHVEAICDELIRRGLTIPWECEIRVNTVDPPLLQKMKAAGCYLVDFGIESASEKVLKGMHKGITLAQAEQVIQWTRDLGIAQKAFFTIGHLDETPEDADETLAFIQRNLKRITRPSVGVGIRIYPGTEVEREALARGYLRGFRWSQPYDEERNHLLDVPSNIPVLIQPQMGFQELLELKRRALVVQGSSPVFVLRRVLRAHSAADLKKYARSLTKVLRLTFRGQGLEH